eukprot:m.126458 g.126458  ORF g.126458 m.126458 type:complete len:55 (-) comp9434_c1_seq38:336-500(-)
MRCEITMIQVQLGFRNQSPAFALRNCCNKHKLEEVELEEELEVEVEVEALQRKN